MGAVRKVPLRKCIGCNEMKNKKEMIRVVRTTDNEIILDTTGKKERPRSICVLFGNVWRKAVKKIRGFSRSLNAEIPDEVYEKLKGGVCGT